MEYLIYLRIICLYMAKLYHSISMEKTHYNRIKAVLTEKDKTGMWLAEQMDKNVGTVSRGQQIGNNNINSKKKFGKNLFMIEKVYFCIQNRQK